MESLNEDDPLQETAFTYMAKYAVTNQNELLQLVSATDLMLSRENFAVHRTARAVCQSPLSCWSQSGQFRLFSAAGSLFQRLCCAEYLHSRASALAPALRTPERAFPPSFCSSFHALRTHSLFLVCQINRCKGGICWEELKDTYSTVEEDKKYLQETGSVIAVKNKETNKYDHTHAQRSCVCPWLLLVFAYRKNACYMWVNGLPRERVVFCRRRMAVASFSSLMRG